MMGPTHRQGGNVSALAAFAVLEFNDLLIPGVYPLLQLLIIYPFAHYGATWPDLDHGKQSIPSRDPISLLQWRILHLTTPARKKMKEAGLHKKNPLYTVMGLFDSSHRSWQTHSDLTLVAVLFATLYWSGGDAEVLTSNQLLVRLVGVGFAIGILAHLVLDAITPHGVWSIILVLLKKLPLLGFLPEKISFVPDRKYFATGEGWESRVSQVLKVLSWALILWILLRMLPWDIYTLVLDYFNSKG